MCGIVGLSLRRAQCDASVLSVMRDVLRHRGPDDAGNFVSEGIGLGHRRLSIIDLGGGHQPMQTPDGRYVIVFNGEIYNYRELRRELEAGGSRFTSQSDTEVILHLHARHGDAAVPKLNGIFAYALWDAVTKRLLLVRDRAGIKPLYFFATDQGMGFASEIKALFASGLLAPQLNEAAVAEYLVFRQVAGAGSLFAGVHSLMPGHMMEVVAGRVASSRPYWSALEPVPAFDGTYSAAVDALDAELNRAISRQMVADVPLGTFCSGGIDSSLVTAIASRHAGQSINTFSVGFDEASYDESAYARQAAAACGTRHHELRVGELEFAQWLPKLIWHHDLPLNFANSVHIFAVSELARKHVTVVLTGEGADELFGGYPRYYIPRLLSGVFALPAPLRRAFCGLVGKLPDHRLAKLAYFGRRGRDEAILFNCANVDGDLARPALRNRTPDLSYRKEVLAATRARGYDPISQLMRLDFQTYLVSILDRQDKMSMATSLEARVPFLDNAIIDFAGSLPLSFKQSLRHRKRILKDVALRYLPQQIVHRRKSGFGVPLPKWFAGTGPVAELLSEALQSTEIASLLEPRHIARLRDQHRSGRGDYSELLWGVLNLHLWRKACHA